MVNRIFALAFAVMMAAGTVGYTYSTNAVPLPMPGPEPVPAPLLETFSAEVISPTSADFRWDDIRSPYYVLQGSVDGRMVIDKLLRTSEATLPVVPDTQYVFTVCPLENEANTLTATIKTPEAPRFNRYKTDVYNTYLAFTPDPDVGIYEQKRTGVKSIGLGELFANIENGYRYFIHMDVLWNKTSEPKVLDNCVLVMRAPGGEAFAWDERGFEMEGNSERYFFGCLLDEYLEWYQSTGEMVPGTYTFEYYVDGMFVGKASMRIN